jgi:hypothetical protein
MSVSAPMIKAELYISGGTFLPQSLTAAIGFEPTNSGRRTRDSKLPAEDFWTIEVTKNDYSVNSVVAELLEVIWVRRYVLSEFVSDNNLTINILCNIQIDSGEKPIFDLDISTLKKMSQINACFLMDIFGCSD